MPLKSTFLAFKKVVQVVQMGERGGGGGGVIWTKPKITAVFPQENVPKGERSSAG